MINLKIINELVAVHNIEDLATLINKSKVNEIARANKLSELAIAGNLKEIAREAETLRHNAKSLGLQRVSNRAIELLRTSSLENKGQAYLQCQAITKLIATEIDQDFNAFSDVINL